ncbi:type II toxin-antitoxin system PemI/MazE family antitoxin [Companilactobacillus kedongensis]|uniref:type II toxin-antitoxin system PemI/MazE family antitoxin n=1 Tax=Companilactobacillus kedongensis TaxID=2486004 RepID=UPI000F7A678D|nr:AbrB family transcriptional regulator [Companilactobacillus kedongensis]
MKTRKQGNSIVISIPSEFKIPAGREYMAMADSEGNLIFTPKAENIFTGSDSEDLRPSRDLLGNSSYGRESL